MPALEEELYSGKIRDDEELLKRAKELGATLQVSDSREKVWKKGDILVGEVTEVSLNSDRRRRIYLAPATFLMAEISDGAAKITGRGTSGCIILGNKLTQRLAGETIRKAGGRMSEEIMKSIFIDAGCRTASVSRDYTVFTVFKADARSAEHNDPTDPTAPVNPVSALLIAFQEDCDKSGWRLCGQQ